MRTCLVAAALALAATSAAPAADLKPPPWLPRYDLAVTLDVDRHQVHVTEQVAWVNRTDKPVEQLIFNVHSHFTPPKTAKEIQDFAKLLEIFRIPHREAIYYQNAFDLKKVEALKQVGGEWQREELKHQWHKELATALIVQLAEPVRPGQTASVALTYTIELPQKQGRWGQWKGVTFLTNWHPVLAFHDAENGWQPTPFVPYHQPWFNEAGVFNVRVRLPKQEQVACTGSITKVEEAADSKDVFIGPVVARDFALLTSSRYVEFAGEAANAGGEKVKVKCLAFPEHEHYARSLIGHAARAIEHYSKWFGPYPYPEYTIAESYFGWNGNECSGLVMIDERVFSMPHLADGYVQYLISHETCHQWFYNVVGTNGYKETFMDEAIVVHLSHRLLDLLEGRNNELLNFPPWLSFLPGIQRENYRYSQFFVFQRNRELMPAVQDMEKYGNVIALFAAVYDRGSKIVGTIEDRLGPAGFLEFMRRIYTKYYFRIITVADFQRELEEYTGQKWDRFFKEWLYTADMSDWAVDGVQVVPGAGGGFPCAAAIPDRGWNDRPMRSRPPESPVAQARHVAAPAAELAGTATVGGGYRATVILSQRAQIDEDTTLGFSFDGGVTYPVRVPVKVPRKPLKSDAKDKDKKDEGDKDKSGKAAVTGDDKLLRCERLDETRVLVEVALPEAPNQVAVDPDQVLPDSQPDNNWWDPPVRFRPRPLYTFLDETAFTNDYDKWNVIYGIAAYAPPYAEAWFTRSSIVGLRAGVFRTEEFRGGIYTGYRPTYGDTVVGFDAHASHYPWPKWEAGAHGELSIGQCFQSDDYNPDRAVAWVRHNVEPTSSLYLPPREYYEGFVTYQHNWMPQPRHPTLTGVEFDPLTQLGVHYHKDTQIPYWDPEMGYRIDGAYALGVPVFNQSRTSHQFWGQVSWVTALPEDMGWWSDVKVALRLGGAIGFPKAGRLFTLGGNMWFRGYDVFERQGSCMWVASVEVRLPVKREVDLDVADRLVRLKNVYLAPFLDVGDMYLDRHSLGPVAYAVGVGIRLDVAFFSFLERATVRFDIAQAIDSNLGPQFWFGVQQPF
jgi:Peptidase family M1 domain